jgi:S1-C subfamily serine protease
LEGSGWVSGPDTIVTNAHVVAGDQAPTVEVPGSNSRAAARVVVFDQTNDIAVLKVSGLNARPLVISGETSLGLPAAVIGYPLDGPLSASPARVGGTVAVLTDDAYGRGPMLRTIVVLRALVRPGNSGGPVVDRNGQLLAMVYAKTNGSGSPGGYAVPPSMIEKSLQRATSGAHDQVGPCIG